MKESGSKTNATARVRQANPQLNPVDPPLTPHAPHSQVRCSTRRMTGLRASGATTSSMVTAHSTTAPAIPTMALSPVAARTAMGATCTSMVASMRVSGATSRSMAKGRTTSRTGSATKGSSSRTRWSAKVTPIPPCVCMGCVYVLCGSLLRVALCTQSRLYLCVAVPRPGTPPPILNPTAWHGRTLCVQERRSV